MQDPKFSRNEVDEPETEPEKSGKTNLLRRICSRFLREKNGKAAMVVTVAQEYSHGF